MTRERNRLSESECAVGHRIQHRQPGHPYSSFQWHIAGADSTTGRAHAGHFFSRMKLDGWNWEDAVYALDNGLHLNWPGYMQGRWNNGFRYEPDPDYENKIQELVQLFSEARVYEQQHKDEPVNLKLEAIGPVFQGEKQLFIRANKLREISNAVAFAESFGIRPIIVGEKNPG